MHSILYYIYFILEIKPLEMLRNKVLADFCLEISITDCINLRNTTSCLNILPLHQVLHQF